MSAHLTESAHLRNSKKHFIGLRGFEVVLMNSKGKRGAGKRLNDSQRLEIISKLQRPNPPGIEDVFADILSLGPKIQHSDFEEQSMGLHQNICGAYENLLSIAMNIKRQRTRRMAMRPKIQLTIRDFYE